MTFKNLLLQNHWAIFNQTWHKASLEGIQVYLNEGPNPFPRGDYYKIRENTLTKLKKSLLQNHWANFKQFWHKASLGEDSNEKTVGYHKVYIFSSSLNQRYDIIICVYWFELFSQVSDVAHGPLVYRTYQIWHKASFGGVKGLKFVQMKGQTLIITK